MKHYRINHVIILVSMVFLFSCSSSRKFKSSFPAADTIMNNEGSMDSTLVDSAKVNLQSLQKNRIDFQTFSAKIKVNYADVHGSQPEGNVTLRMYKDSAIWISLSGSILNLEIYRLLIKPDSVIILNKLEKTVEYLPFRFMEEIAHIPLDFTSLQDLLTGNPIFLGDQILGFQSSGKNNLIATEGTNFKNIIALSKDLKLMQTMSLTEKNAVIKRSIQLFYGDYIDSETRPFSTTREIIVEDENQLKIALNFRQVEFNKELSLTFNVPPNYKIK